MLFSVAGLHDKSLKECGYQCSGLEAVDCGIFDKLCLNTEESNEKRWNA